MVMLNADASRHRARWTLLLIAVVAITAAVVLWRFTPLADLVTPRRLSAWLSQIRDQPWSPFAIAGLFVIGGLVFFPVLVLISVTALVLDPVIALITAFAGTLASALTTYAIGAYFMRNTAHSAFGPVLTKVSTALAARGVIAIAVIRMLPFAPFSLINLAAGSIGVNLRDFTIGTMLGIAPGVVAITAFGGQLRRVLERPTPGGVAALVAIVAGWIVLSLLLQRVVTRRQRARAAD